MISEKMKPFMANNSAIRAMFEEGKRMAAVYGRENVYDFSLGNPNVPVPQVTEAILDVVKNEDFMTLHGYMSNAGYEDVRQTIAESLNKRFGTNFSFKNLIMTVGAASGLNIILKSILNPGDEVIVFAPYFVEYNAYVRNYDGNVVVISPDTETFMPKLDEFEAKITAKTKAVIINNPNNPTGAVYPKETLLKLVDIAREFGLIIFADEVYDKILYEDAKHIAIASLSTDVLTITFNSLSKAYRACGYRAGWMIISGNKLPARDFIEGLNMLANMKLCANVPGQWAIQTALGGYQSINDLVCEGGRLRVQRDLAWELLTQIPGVTCVKPQGSLYMFPRLDPKIYPIENDRQFFKELLEATRVLLVQGTGFNWPHPDHFRVVFLPHEPQLREAISRIAEYLAAWRAAHPVKEEPATPRKKEGAAE